MSSKPPSPLVFLLISTHFTATLGIPLASPSLKKNSFKCSLWVKPIDFTSDLLSPPARPLHPVNPDNARHLRITAACWHVVSRGLFIRYRHIHSSLIKEVYNPKAFFLHAALLGQAFAHCPIFPTAASRRSLGRISVPMWPFILSDRLLIVAMVGLYPRHLANRHEPIFQRIAPLIQRRCRPRILCGISSRFQLLSPSERQVAHVLLTRSPLSHIRSLTEISELQASFDLHVLGTPPAFVLSQDQTLKYGISTELPLYVYLFELSVTVSSKELFASSSELA